MKLCNLMSEYMHTLTRKKEPRGVNFFIDLLNPLIRPRFYLRALVSITFIAVTSARGFT